MLCYEVAPIIYYLALETRHPKKIYWWIARLIMLCHEVARIISRRINGQENIPAAREEKKQDTRLHQENEVQGRQARFEQQARQRQEMLNGLTRAEFAKAYSKGIKYRHRTVGLIILDRPGKETKFGICFQKKMNASRRNKLKRRIRSILCLFKDGVASGKDIILSVSPDTIEYPFAELKDTIAGKLKETGLL
jgi:ribonuclease P protein component